MQNDAMLLCPNVVVNIHNEMTRKAKLFNLGPLKRLVFVLNVGQRDGKTFIGGPQNGGNDIGYWLGNLPQTSLTSSMILYGTFHKLECTKRVIWCLPTLPVRLIGKVMNVTGDAATTPCRVAVIYVVLLLWYMQLW